MHGSSGSAGGGIAGGGAGGVTALQTAQKALHFFRVLSLFSHVSPAATFSWHHSIGFLLTHGGGGNGGGNGGAAGWPGGMGVLYDRVYM